MAAALDPDEVLRSTSGKANFQRVTRLLIGGGTVLLRESFDQLCPPSHLLTMLKNPATEKKLKAAKLTKPQWDCVYPSPGVYGKSAEFDVTLLFKLLRTICSLSPPVTGWDALPTSTNYSLTADLARIKYYRNSVYGHVNQNMEITDDEFPLLWQEISEAIVRVAGQISLTKKTEWQGAIDNFLKDPLTAEDERNVEELMSWYRKEMEVKKSVDELKSTTQKGVERLEKLEVKGRRLVMAVREESQKMKAHLGEQLDATTGEFREGMGRLETSLKEKGQNVEMAVREESQKMKDHLGEQLNATTEVIRDGMGRLKSRLNGVQGGLQAAVREETQHIKDKLEEVHQSIANLNSQAESSLSPRGKLIRLFSSPLLQTRQN